MIKIEPITLMHWSEWFHEVNIIGMILTLNLNSVKNFKKLKKLY